MKTQIFFVIFALSSATSIAHGDSTCVCKYAPPSGFTGARYSLEKVDESSHEVLVPELNLDFTGNNVCDALLKLESDKTCKIAPKIKEACDTALHPYSNEFINLCDGLVEGSLPRSYKISQETDEVDDRDKIFIEMDRPGAIAELKKYIADGYFPNAGLMMKTGEIYSALHPVGFGIGAPIGNWTFQRTFLNEASKIKSSELFFDHFKLLPDCTNSPATILIAWKMDEDAINNGSYFSLSYSAKKADGTRDNLYQAYKYYSISTPGSYDCFKRLEQYTSARKRERETNVPVRPKFKMTWSKGLPLVSELTFVEQK